MKIMIIGAGHMGVWLAHNLSENNQVGLFDKVLEKAYRVSRKNQSIHTLDSLDKVGIFHPDILINAVSIRSTRKAFESVIPHLDSSVILSDTASIKGGLHEFYESCGFRYVSVHPMFGPTFANVDRLDEENAVIISESDTEGAGFFRSFFSHLGINLYEYSFCEHDEMMAYSLTLPFASSMVFAACMKSTAVPGTTFKKHRLIAEGLLEEDDDLLSEILFNPRSLAQLEKVTHKLEFLKHVIRGRDTEEAGKFFGRLRSNIKPSS